MIEVVWERIMPRGDADLELYRARVPNGWLITDPSQKHLVFVPDSDHDWRSDVAGRPTRQSL